MSTATKPLRPENEADTFGRVLLVGHPNVGKSVLFNQLSDDKVTVSNYPGTTVDLHQSLVQLDGSWTELVDTPGTRSLVAASDDERVTQRCLLDNPGVPVTQVGDSKNLRRTLFLTTQLIELEMPLVLVLNMLDECRALDLEPRHEKLEAALGLPVRPTTGITGEGVDEVEHAMTKPCVGSFKISYPQPIEQAIESLSALLPSGSPGKRGLSLLMLTGDDTAEAWLQEQLGAEVVEKFHAIRKTAARAFAEPLSLVIHQTRYDEVAHLAKDVLVHTAGDRRLRRAIAVHSYFFAVLPLLGAMAGWAAMHLLNFAALRFAVDEPNQLLLESVVAVIVAIWFAARGVAHRKRKLSIKESLGELAIFPSTALPILVLTLYASYVVVGDFAAGTCVDFIETNIFATVNGGPGFEFFGIHVPWNGINYYLASAAKLVVSEENLVYQLFFGPPSSAVDDASDMGIVTVGITYSVAIVLPIVVVFFLVFSLLEDSGFLPRIAVLTDRLLKCIGLNGKAVLPLILGLGCDTMATMTTRILETRKERMVAILLLALAVPCSAQLTIVAGVMTRVSPLCLFLFIIIVLSQLVFVGSIASRIFRGRAADFVIEVPPVRRPLLRNVFSKTYSRMKWFLIEAVPLFVLGTFALFVVDRLGIIPVLVDAGQPVVTGLLGLPEQTTIGFLLGFLRRDFAAVHILNDFVSAEGAAAADDVRQMLVAVVVITLFVPCLANYFMMVREQGAKVATAMGAFIFPYAIVVGMLLHHALKLIPDVWLES